MSAPDQITTVISDFGGVLTTPLVQSFAAVQDETGIPFEELGKAMAEIERVDGKHPLYELEKGQLTEEEFLTKLGDALEPALGHRPELHRFREIYFDALHPNQPMIDLMREAKAGGTGWRCSPTTSGSGSRCGVRCSRSTRSSSSSSTPASSATGSPTVRSTTSPSSGLAAPIPVNACSSTTPTSTARRRRSSG